MQCQHTISPHHTFKPLSRCEFSFNFFNSFFNLFYYSYDIHLWISKRLQSTVVKFCPFWCNLAGLSLQVRVFTQFPWSFFKFVLLQLRNAPTKFQKAEPTYSKVTLFLVEIGLNYLSRCEFLLNLFDLFLNSYYYSYRMRLRNFKELSPAIPKLHCFW